MDRWIAYVQRLRPVLKRIPMQQKQSQQYRVMYARKVVQPPRLNKMVLTAVCTTDYTQIPRSTMLDAKRDLSKTMWIIRASDPG